ncbi:MAG: redoxin family protein [candidate division Zixibacteria bacterium]|nr:redoxin family protein [candidate division Zixibacteria bacterium]
MKLNSLVGAAALVALLAAGTACRGKNMMFGKSVSVYAPEFPAYPADRWINSGPLTMKGLRGRVVLIDFWEYTCVNCIRTLPYLAEWHRRYAAHGVVIVGVHTPEFAFGRDRANVARAVEEFGIEYPVVLDNDYEIWQAYANRFWPRKYVVDRDGKIVYDHAGEGGYAEAEELLQRLIRKKDADAELPPIMAPVRPEDAPGAYCYPRTPELYCGYKRGKYGNEKPPLPGRTQLFADDGPHAEGHLYLSGKWRLGEEEATFAGEPGPPGENYILVPFAANEINAVMAAPPGETIRVYVKRDGVSVAKRDAGADVAFDDAGSYVDVSVGRMYRLLDARKYDAGELSLHPTRPGVSAFAFTFGSCAANP